MHGGTSSCCSILGVEIHESVFGGGFHRGREPLWQHQWAIVRAARSSLVRASFLYLHGRPFQLFSQVFFNGGQDQSASGHAAGSWPTGICLRPKLRAAVGCALVQGDRTGTAPIRSPVLVGPPLPMPRGCAAFQEPGGTRDSGCGHQGHQCSWNAAQLCA